jgi:hypothetical protein
MIPPCVLDFREPAREHGARVQEIESSISQVFSRLAGSKLMSTDVLMIRCNA